MTKVNKVVDGQESVFDLLAKARGRTQEVCEGGLNIRYQLQGILSAAIAQSRLSRWEIAGRMSALLNIEVTKFRLDSWTAESKEYHRFPAEYLPAFCQVVGSYQPLEFLAEKAGVFVVPGQEALRAEIQKIESEIKELHAIKRKRLLFLSEMGGETWADEQ
jgi:hypothetical protein